MGEGSTVRVAAVGCGGLGKKHIHNLASLPGVDLVGVADPQIEVAQAFAVELASAPKVYSSHRDLLDSTSPDAVVVTTPNFTHREISVDAATAGAHVFCEKPMALSIGDCDAMIAAADRAGVHLMIGYVRRYQAAYRKIKHLVEDGEIGDIHMIHAIRLGAGAPGGVGAWQRKRALYGGMYSMYSHELDQLMWLAGDVAAVTAVVRPGVDPEDDVEEAISMGLEFTSSAIGSLMSSRIHPVPSYELGIAGSSGVVKLANPNGPILLGRAGESTTTSVEVASNDGLLDEMADFIEGIRTGRRPTSDGAAGRAVVAVAKAAEASALTGTRVAVNPPA